MTENEIATIVVDAALVVHKRLGSGLLESAYERALTDELRRRRVSCETQVPVYMAADDGTPVLAYRADIIVGNLVILEIKSVEAIVDVFVKQLLTYLRLANKRLGLAINFGAEKLKGNIRRVVNGLPDD